MTTQNSCHDPQAYPIIALAAAIGVVFSCYNINSHLIYIRAQQIVLVAAVILNFATALIYFITQFWWGGYSQITCLIFSFSYLSGLTWDINRQQQALIGQTTAVVFQLTILVIAITAAQYEQICGLLPYQSIPVFNVAFQISSLVTFLRKLLIQQRQHDKTINLVPFELQNQIRLYRFLLPGKIDVKAPWDYYAEQFCQHQTVGLDFGLNLLHSGIQLTIQTDREMTATLIGKNKIELQQKTDLPVGRSTRKFLSEQARIDLLKYYTLQSASQGTLTLEISKSDVLNDFMRALLSTPLEQHSRMLNIKISEHIEDQQILLAEGLSTVAYKLFGTTQSCNSEEELSQFSESEGQNQPNNLLIISSDGYSMISPEISSSNAYLMGWVLGKCLFHSVPIKCRISKLLLGLTAGLKLKLSDIASFDTQFALELRQAELNDHLFHALVNSIGNVKHDIIQVKGSEQRYHAIHVAHAVELKYFQGQRIKIQALQLGFKNAIPSPADHYLSTELLEKKLVGTDITAKDMKMNCFFSESVDLQQWFFEIMENQKYRETILRLATGLRCISKDGFDSIGGDLFLRGQKGIQIQLVDQQQRIQGVKFGILQLPQFETKQKLEDALKVIADSMRDEK